jgi:hypothetical protein
MHINNVLAAIMAATTVVGAMPATTSTTIEPRERIEIPGGGGVDSDLEAAAATDGPACGSSTPYGTYFCYANKAKKIDGIYQCVTGKSVLISSCVASKLSCRYVNAQPYCK